jgi:hypothetical protein
VHISGVFVGKSVVGHSKVSAFAGSGHLEVESARIGVLFVLPLPIHLEMGWAVKNGEVAECGDWSIGSGHHDSILTAELRIDLCGVAEDVFFGVEPFGNVGRVGPRFEDSVGAGIEMAAKAKGCRGKVFSLDFQCLHSLVRIG